MVINVSHVVLRGNVKVREMFEKLEPIFVKNEKGILRTANIYIDRDGKSILIESLAIERAKKTQFLCMISAREDGIVVRVYPGFEVKKTNGVKRILVEVSHQLTKKIPQLTVGETNLSEYFTQSTLRLSLLFGKQQKGV